MLMNLPRSMRAIAAPLALGLAAGLWTAEAPAADAPAPEIMGRSIDGALFRLSSQRGQAVVLNFFSVNCIPCREEMPELAELARHHPKVRFIAAHVDDIDDDVVKAWVKKLRAAPPTVVLASHRVQQIYGTNTRGLPETHLIDSAGKIAQTLSGYTPANLAALKDWLARQK